MIRNTDPILCINRWVINICKHWRIFQNRFSRNWITFLDPRSIDKQLRVNILNTIYHNKPNSVVFIYCCILLEIVYQLFLLARKRLLFRRSRICSVRETKKKIGKSGQKMWENTWFIKLERSFVLTYEVLKRYAQNLGRFVDGTRYIILVSSLHKRPFALFI